MSSFGGSSMSSSPSRSTAREVERAVLNDCNTIRQKELTKSEKKFLLAVEQAELAQVQFYLDNAAEMRINLNCSDPWGRSALIIAIENDNMSLINLLLQRNLELNDALLHAINHEHVDAVSAILQHQDVVESHHKDLQKFFGESTSQSFSQEITPLMLACHKDNYPIINLLLERGHYLELPHALTCVCRECKRAIKENSIRRSKARFNTYKAMACPSLICLTSKDPVLTTFELCYELERLSQCEYEFSKQYHELAESVKTFACTLLDQTRSVSEVSAMLNHEAGSPHIQELLVKAVEKMRGNPHYATENDQLIRLKLAVDFGQKAFVAHPHCQELLSARWFDAIPECRENGEMYKFFCAVTIGCFFPLLALVVLIAPASRLGRIAQMPFAKFCSQTASYLFFILLIMFDATGLEGSIRGMDRLQDSSVRPIEVIEIAIMIYLLGFLIRDAKFIFVYGLREYLGSAWNLVTIGMLCFFFCVIGLRAAAYVDVLQMRTLLQNSTWNDPRSGWTSYHPMIVSEGLLACAFIIAVLRFVEVFTLLRGLGPLMISIGNVMRGIFLFFVVYFMVIFAFAIGLQQLLWFYGYMWQIELCYEDNVAGISTVDAPEYGPHSTRCLTQGSEWNNLFNIFQSLYWAIFGLVFPNDLHNGYNHSFESLIAKLIFGTYMFAAWPLLLNLLIAFIIHTYSAVRSREDIEWKFERARMFVRYFSADENVPIPFNIFPSMKFVKRSFGSCAKIFHRATLEEDQRIEHRLASVRHRISAISQKQAHYESVMNEVIKRYLMHRYKCVRSQVVNIDDITELKQDLLTFRSDLLSVFQYNGIDVPARMARREAKVRRKKQHQISYFREGQVEELQARLRP